MKEFSLEPINKQINEMLEEMLVELQKFEELRCCYTKNHCIKLETDVILTVDKAGDFFTIGFDWRNVWEKINLNRQDVFDNVGNDLQSIKIKEPQPHQARKRTLEELGEGNGFYLFDNNYRMNEEAIKDVNCYKYFTITCDNYDEFQNLIKYTRILLAIDEEEIKNKRLD